MKASSFMVVVFVAAIQVLLVSAGVFSKAAAEETHVATASGLLPYKLSIPTFIGSVNSDNITLKGESEHVLKELEAKFPGVNLTSAADQFTTGLDGSTLSKRKHPIWPPLCIPIAGWGWRGVSSKGLSEAQKILRRKGVSVIEGKSCSRLACWQGNAIFLCNDAPLQVALSSWWISNQAYDIRDNCSKRHPQDWRWVGGQLFDDNGYNTILRWDQSCTNLG